MIALLLPFLQLMLKLVPILYQIKVIRSEEELKEFQRRFKDAINKAEGNALDSVDLRKQHKENTDKLREDWKKVWGNKPMPPPQEPTPDTIPPSTPSEITIKGPEEAEAGQTFYVEIYNAPAHAEIWRDRTWKLTTVGGRTKVPVVFMMGGDPLTIQVKIGEAWVAEHKMKVTDSR
jgi:hypothetical protein